MNDGKMKINLNIYLLLFLCIFTFYFALLCPPFKKL